MLSIKAASVRVGHQPVKLRPLPLRAGIANVHVLAGKDPAAALGVLSKLAGLHRGILTVVYCADPGVNRATHLESVG
jgi:hypothetical protein